MIQFAANLWQYFVNTPIFALFSFTTKIYLIFFYKQLKFIFFNTCKGLNINQPMI